MILASVCNSRPHFVAAWWKQSIFAVSKSVLAVQNFTELSLLGGGFVGLPHSVVEEFKDILGIFDSIESNFLGMRDGLESS